MFLRIALALLLCGSAVTPAFAQGASTWFLAEGASNGTFDEDILVGNPSPGTVTVTVKLLPAPDAVIAANSVLEKAFAVPGTGRLTVNIRREFPGLNGATSAQVSAVVQGTATPASIVVERSMFFPLAATPYAGGTGASGVTAPATRWILAEGASGAFSTFILVANPGNADGVVTARYLRGDGTTVSESVPIEAGKRATLWPSINPGLANQGFSTVVESTVPVVAERAMYFDDFRSGHDALGIAAPSGSNGRTSWYFAEGFTGGNAQIAFETFLLIGNDNAQPASVTATYFLDTGAPITRTYTVQPKSRFNIWVDNEKDGNGTPIVPATAFSVRIESDLEVVAERAVYWGTPSSADPNTPTFPWKEGHVVAGIEGPEKKWAFAEGRQGQDISGASYDSFFLVVNPNAVDIDIRAIFATEDGTGLTRTVKLAANTRGNIWPSAGLPEFALLQGRRFAVFLESDQPFVAERAMYWNEFTGGHANAGAPWVDPEPFAQPAQAPLDVKVTGMTPTSGRLSGGSVVTISGENFGLGGGTEVYFAGTRVAPTAVGPNAITFTVPTRSALAGFGTAGPAAVAVFSRGRYVRAPNYTRYLSVLAFGDSLTWGTHTYYVGGQKVSVQTQTPYPRGLRDMLAGVPQFGPYALVSNAGWPGEWLTASGFNGSPGGVARAARCTAGQANCFYPQSADPRDYLTPHDVLVFLEGVNDLNNAVSPSTVANRARDVVLDAKARGLQVLLVLFGPYGNDQQTGQPATDPQAVKDYNGRLNSLAVEQATSRESVSAQMGPDGLHPNQTGYDEMAEAIYRKLLTMFPRCAAGVTTCQ